jgi:hypothetical protein
MFNTIGTGGAREEDFLETLAVLYLAVEPCPD